MLFDKQVFFKRQVEECRELERQAVNAEDQAFWRQIAARWEEQLRQRQPGSKSDTYARAKLGAVA